MTAVIVEDDFIVADHLKMILESYDVHVLSIIDNVSDAIDSLEKKVDFYFVDIRLSNNGNGIELGKRLDEKGVPFAYVSANNEITTLREAAVTNPIAYLTKPYKEIDILALLEVYKAKKHKETIVFRGSNNKNEIVEVNSILYCISDGSYVEIFTTDKRYFERISLVDLEAKLGSKFIRSHRSYLINSDHISGYSSNYLHIGDEKVPISRSHKVEVQTFLDNRLKG